MSISVNDLDLINHYNNDPVHMEHLFTEYINNITGIFASAVQAIPPSNNNTNSNLIDDMYKTFMRRVTNIKSIPERYKPMFIDTNDNTLLIHIPLFHTTINYYSINVVIDVNKKLIAISTYRIPRSRVQLHSKHIYSHIIIRINDKRMAMHADTIWESEVYGPMEPDYTPNTIPEQTTYALITEVSDYCLNLLLCKLYTTLNITKFRILNDKFYCITFKDGDTKFIPSVYFGYAKDMPIIPWNFYTTIYGASAVYEDTTDTTDAKITTNTFTTHSPIKLSAINKRSTIYPNDIYGTYYSNFITLDNMTYEEFLDKLPVDVTTGIFNLNIIDNDNKYRKPYILITLNTNNIPESIPIPSIGGSNRLNHILKYKSIHKRRPTYKRRTTRKTSKRRQSKKYTPDKTIKRR